MISSFFSARIVQLLKYFDSQFISLSLPGDKKNSSHQAYVFPGLMCPALVSKELYHPLQYETICPDKTFYKFQVAHYCCLYKASELYNFGPDFDPNDCYP